VFENYAKTLNKHMDRPNLEKALRNRARRLANRKKHQNPSKKSASGDMLGNFFSSIFFQFLVFAKKILVFVLKQSKE